MDIQDTSKIIKRSHRESERERDRVSCVLHTSKQHLNTFLQQALYIAPSRTSTNINNKQILTQFVIASGSSCKHITSAFSDANVAQMRSPRPFATSGALALQKRTGVIDCLLNCLQIAKRLDLRDMMTLYFWSAFILQSQHLMIHIFCNGIMHVYYIIVI